MSVIGSIRSGTRPSLYVSASPATTRGLIPKPYRARRRRIWSSELPCFTKILPLAAVLQAVRIPNGCKARAILTHRPRMPGVPLIDAPDIIARGYTGMRDG